MESTTLRIQLGHWLGAVCCCILPFTPVTFAGDEKPTESPVETSAEEGEKTLPEGHSIHGEVFNEGPRQAAVLMDDVGATTFTVTSENEEARRFVAQGVAQLHGFWYFESERSFRQAAMLDENCAIAYWGMAVANRRNQKRATGFIDKAMEKKSAASRKEVLLIEAFDRYIKAKTGKDTERRSRAERYVRDLETILLEFPDDLEIKALLCEYLWSGRRDGLPQQSFLAVNSLIQDVLDTQALHPVHHFRIHLWDGKKPELALESAARCGMSAPGIAHMWHMPGHIYSRLKRYHDAVWQQEASARVDHAHMMRYQVLPDQIHNFAHNNEWCIRNLIAIGRANDAEALALNMISLPRHPKYNDINRGGSFRYGHQRLIDVLTAFEDWERLAELSETAILQEIGREDEELHRDRAVAAAMVMLDRESDATPIRERIESLHNEQVSKRDKAAAEAEKKARDEKKDDKAIAAARTSAERPFATKIRNFEKALNEIDGRIAFQKQDFSTAADLLKKAGIPDEQLALVLHLAGNTEEAVKKLESRVSSRDSQILPLVAQTQLLFEAGKKEEAKATFEKLRQISSVIDLDARPVQRLAPIAKEFGFQEDWRVDRTLPEDLGPQPDLKSLGPFRWAPTAASPWSLPDLNAKPLALNQFRGRPVVVVFYLGYGCLHCAEQLQEMQKRFADFESAGLEIVAISTDRQEDLKRAADDLESGFSFPLAADPDLEIFRQYRCYDDFEKTPLHGTFLIDSDGRVRWHDISYEPFMNMDFLLEESKRLIAIPASGSTEWNLTRRAVR